MKRAGILVIAIEVLFLCGTTRAAILHVPDDYLTIQAALVYAETDDTILVAPGTYYEHIVWPSTHGIDLVSEYGADSTFIDAFGSLPVITMQTYVDSTTFIKGFTIMNGGYEYGGGIYCIGASPTISNNTIKNNTAFYGAGIFCSECSPIVKENVIMNNAQSGTGDGGGISCWFANARITGNVIVNNSGNDGGGISAIVSCPEIIGNTVTGNLANLGGGMYFFKSTPTINNNIVSSNDAEYGDGLYFYQSGGKVNYNDIFENGCGMYIADPVQVNAEYNWWGDSTGPYHITNPYGLGDTVSDGVDFDPWLDHPVGVVEETEHHVENREVNTTIVSGPLVLPKGTKCKVFDITGRVVTPDKIRPGIYFIEIDGKIAEKIVKIR